MSRWFAGARKELKDLAGWFGCGFAAELVGGGRHRKWGAESLRVVDILDSAGR